MSRFFIGPNGYFEAITEIDTPEGATEVPQRPAPWWTWSGSEWVEGEPVTLPSLYDPFRLLDALTDEEAATFEAALAQPPAKQRLLWQKSRLLDSSHPDWATFSAMLTAAFGAERAAEILEYARLA